MAKLRADRQCTGPDCLFNQSGTGIASLGKSCELCGTCCEVTLAKWLQEPHLKGRLVTKWAKWPESTLQAALLKVPLGMRAVISRAVQEKASKAKVAAPIAGTGLVAPERGEEPE